MFSREVDIKKEVNINEKIDIMGQVNIEEEVTLYVVKVSVKEEDIIGFIILICQGEKV